MIVAVERLSGCGVSYGCESEGVDLDTESRHVLLLELSGQMALDKGGLSTQVSIIPIGIGGMAGQSPRLMGKGGVMIRGMGDIAIEGTYLSGASITDKHKLEGGNLLCGSFGHGV